MLVRIVLFLLLAVSLAHNGNSYSSNRSELETDESPWTEEKAIWIYDNLRYKRSPGRQKAQANSKGRSPSSKTSSTGQQNQSGKSFKSTIPPSRIGGEQKHSGGGLTSLQPTQTSNPSKSQAKETLKQFSHTGQPSKTGGDQKPSSGGLTLLQSTQISNSPKLSQTKGTQKQQSSKTSKIGGSQSNLGNGLQRPLDEKTSALEELRTFNPGLRESSNQYKDKHLLPASTFKAINANTLPALSQSGELQKVAFRKTPINTILNQEEASQLIHANNRQVRGGNQNPKTGMTENLYVSKNPLEFIEVKRSEGMAVVPGTGPVKAHVSTGTANVLFKINERTGEPYHLHTLENKKYTSARTEVLSLVPGRSGNSRGGPIEAIPSGLEPPEKTRGGG